MKTNILFVCLGNICRSPAADGIMHHIVEERGLSGRIGIDSAGTYAGHTGELPDARMRRAAARRGYDLGMREIFRRHPRWDHVPDPYYEGAEGFELVLDMLEDGCGGILEYLENPQ